MASAAGRTGSASTASAVAAAASGALSGLLLLAAAPGLLPRSQPPWAKVPALPQKAEAVLSKPRPASPHAPEACSRGQNPIK